MPSQAQSRQRIGEPAPPPADAPEHAVRDAGIAKIPSPPARTETREFARDAQPGYALLAPPGHRQLPRVSPRDPMKHRRMQRETRPRLLEDEATLASGPCPTREKDLARRFRRTLTPTKTRTRSSRPALGSDHRRTGQETDVLPGRTSRPRPIRTPIMCSRPSRSADGNAAVNPCRPS